MAMPANSAHWPIEHTEAQVEAQNAATKTLDTTHLKARAPLLYPPGSFIVVSGVGHLHRAGAWRYSFAGHVTNALQ